MIRGVATPLRVEPAPVDAAVVGLDLADRGQEGPVEVAGEVGGVDDGGRPLVRRERDVGDGLRVLLSEPGARPRDGGR